MPAIAAVLANGLRTADIKSEGTTAVSTTQMGEAILRSCRRCTADPRANGASFIVAAQRDPFTLAAVEATRSRVEVFFFLFFH